MIVLLIALTYFLVDPKIAPINLKGNVIGNKAAEIIVPNIDDFALDWVFTILASMYTSFAFTTSFFLDLKKFLKILPKLPKLANFSLTELVILVNPSLSCEKNVFLTSTLALAVFTIKSEALILAFSILIDLDPLLGFSTVLCVPNPLKNPPTLPKNDDVPVAILLNVSLIYLVEVLNADVILDLIPVTVDLIDVATDLIAEIADLNGLTITFIPDLIADFNEFGNLPSNAFNDLNGCNTAFLIAPGIALIVFTIFAIEFAIRLNIPIDLSFGCFSFFFLPNNQLNKPLLSNSLKMLDKISFCFADIFVCALVWTSTGLIDVWIGFAILVSRDFNSFNPDFENTSFNDLSIVLIAVLNWPIVELFSIFDSCAINLFIAAWGLFLTMLVFSDFSVENLLSFNIFSRFFWLSEISVLITLIACSLDSLATFVSDVFDFSACCEIIFLNEPVTFSISVLIESVCDFKDLDINSLLSFEISTYTTSDSIISAIESTA